MALRNSPKTALLPLSMLAALGGCGAAADAGDDATSSSTDDGTTDPESEGDATSTAATDDDAGSDDAVDAEDSGSAETGSDESSSDESSSDDSGSDDESTDTGSEVEPDFAMIDLSRPIDVTPDGSIALVEDPSNLQLDAYFYDTATGDLTYAATIGDAAFDFSTAISDTRRISALHDVPVQAGLWTQAGGWLDLESPYATGCDDVAAAWDVSADGSVAVGMAWNSCSAHAFRWVDDGGAGTTTALDVIGTGWNGNPPTNRATVVSDDGLVIAGFAQNGGAVDRAAAVWQADGTGILLAPNEEWPQEVLSISADGQMVAGTRGYDGFYWTEAEGMTSLGQLPEADAPTNTFPNVIAADAELVAGGFGDPWGFSVPVAFVWTRDDGMRSLHEIIEANGLDVPEGVVLTNVVAASADGSVLLGSAYDADGYPKSFVLRLAPSAYGLYVSRAASRRSSCRNSGASNPSSHATCS